MANQASIKLANPGSPGKMAINRDREARRLRTGTSSWLAAASEDNCVWVAAMVDGMNPAGAWWCCEGNDIVAPVTASTNWMTEPAGDGW